MRIQLLMVLLAGLLVPPVDVAGADISDADIDDETFDGHVYKPGPGSEWAELELRLPDYPDEDNLVEIDISRFDYPFTVYVDTGSVSVGKDRVIRYTAVLRSKAGAENISYEGIQCNQRKIKRYAYPSRGRFMPVPNAEWRFIRTTRQDIYRAVLADSYFCPSPLGDVVKEIVKKLKANEPR